MKNSRLVRITEQTFQDAGGKEIFGKLQMIGPIYASNNEIESGNEKYKTANESLIEEAKKIKADYIFDVRYELVTGFVKTRGIAYKIRHPLRRFFTGWK